MKLWRIAEWEYQLRMNGHRRLANILGWWSKRKAQADVYRMRRRDGDR